MVTVRNPANRLGNELYDAMQEVLDTLFNTKDSDGGDLSSPFHDLLPKRAYADYYKLIKSPQALNPVQASVRRRSYTSFGDFVKDCAQIFFNAKVYNRHDSEIYQYADTLENVLKQALQKCVRTGKVKKEEAELPFLGELPPPSPEATALASPLLEAEEEEEDDEEDDEEEDDESDDNDEEEEDGKKRRNSSGRARRTTRGGSVQPRATRRRTGTVGASGEAREEDGEEETGGRKVKDDPRRKRGRPPRVDTPMETRIKNILKALRKLKDEETGNQRMLAFDKLPEKKEFPEYFTEIKNPIAMDIIKKNIKRRVYKTMDHFIGDMDLMFDNARTFNEDESQLHQDAVMLQDELHRAEQSEMAKLDEELAGGEDGTLAKKIPLDKIEHNGETYRVGDWVHIVNPNDPNKPTVAQVFRTWKERDGQVWINACWYFRPEQTVHWVEKRFYPEEVVKTGQYRDHKIDEVIGKCFVMFFTRYSRGRPRGIDESKCPIYVCESRYNERTKHFNKIKTWKSCIPDEVRGGDYELDMFEKQRTLKKMNSPIAHTLPPGAKEGDPLPEAKLGVENAPPVVGAVFKRARRETDSPPPEPTPPPPPPPPVIEAPAPRPTRRQSTASTAATDPYHETMSMTQMYKQAASVAAPTPGHGPQTPMPTMHHDHQLRTPAPQHFAPPPVYHNPPQPMQRMPSTSGMGAGTPSYAATQAAQAAQLQINLNRHHSEHKDMQPPHGLPAPAAAPAVTFTLPELIAKQIPEATAERFLRNENGQILWFSVPPVDNRPAERPFGGLGHSAQYLAHRREREEKHEARAREREAQMQEGKRKAEEDRKEDQKQVKRLLVTSLGLLTEQIRESLNAEPETEKKTEKEKETETEVASVSVE